MSASLLDSLTAMVTPDLISKAASAFGDSEPAVSKGMAAAFPVLLGSIANRASDPGFANTLFNLVRDPANDGSLLGNVASLLSPGASSSPMMALGGKLLGSLYGNNLGNLGGQVANFAGMKTSAASSLLNFAAPMVLAALSKAVRAGNLNLGSLTSLLTGERSRYTAALPGPLSRLESYFAAPVRETVREVAPPVVEKKSSIWRWLLPLLIALAALWLLSRCMGAKETTVETVAPAPQTEVAPTPMPEPLPAPAPVDAAPAVTTPSANLYFDVDKTEVPAGADAALAGVIEYLKANPAATAVVSGYHDPSGDKAHNEELAKNRAIAVRDLLTIAGIEEGRIEMQKPIETTGSGSADEARRVEITVR